jgi:hypothetical protein
MIRHLLASAASLCLTIGVNAAPAFVNALVLDGAAIDASGGNAVNNGRLGYFSDLYYDPQRNEWWALSDRGPGGGTMQYETRLHRMHLDVDLNTGAISNPKVLETLILRSGLTALDGFSPAPFGPLGVAFDPEGVVVNPRTGHFYMSDEYGPSVFQFNRFGQKVRTFVVPDNLLPRNRDTGAVNHAGDAGNNAGKRTNRGFEGLAISPDGRRLFATLQSAMLDEGAGDGVWVRIVEFDTGTARSVAQYAYKMDAASQGRGVSALVALNDDELLVLERNNRGLGVDANLASPNKKVFKISLRSATDISNVSLTAAGAVFTPVTKASAAWMDLALPATLAHPSLTELGGVSPEKWEGLTIGPRLADGSYLVLAGTDNDYSVTQNASGTQRDVYFKPTVTIDAAGVSTRSVSRIQCDISTFNNCLTVNADGTPGSAVAATFSFSGYRLVPGVLHAYKATPSDLADYVPAGVGVPF